MKMKAEMHTVDPGLLEERGCREEKRERGK